jgi:hypothetical protein
MARAPDFEAKALPDGAASSSEIIEVNLPCRVYGSPLILEVDFYNPGRRHWGPGIWQGVCWSGKCREDSVKYEALPSLDETRDSCVNDAGYAVLAGGGADTSVLAAGYSYDALDLMQPVLWARDVHDTSWSLTQLPTLGGMEGRVKGYRSCLDLPVFFLVGSSVSGESEEKAVVWTLNESGGWAIRTLPDFGPALASRADDAFVSAESETTVCGWAEVSELDTVAVVWENHGLGWNIVTLPELPGGMRGAARSLAGSDEEGIFVAGWAEDASGRHCAVVWYDRGLGWQVEAMTMLSAHIESEATGVSFTGERDDEVVAVGSSYGPGPRRATIWGDVGEGGDNWARDLNSLVVSADPPYLANASGVGVVPDGRMLIAANSTHAYLLLEATPVPIARSHTAVLVLAVGLMVFGVFLLRSHRPLSRTRQKAPNGS